MQTNIIFNENLPKRVGGTFGQKFIENKKSFDTNVHHQSEQAPETMQKSVSGR